MAVRNSTITASNGGVNLQKLAGLFDEKYAEYLEKNTSHSRSKFLASLGFVGVIEQARASAWWNESEFPSLQDVRRLRKIFGEQIISVFGA